MVQARLGIAVLPFGARVEPYLDATRIAMVPLNENMGHPRPADRQCATARPPVPDAIVLINTLTGQSV